MDYNYKVCCIFKQDVNMCKSTFFECYATNYLDALTQEYLNWCDKNNIQNSYADVQNICLKYCHGIPQHSEYLIIPPGPHTSSAFIVVNANSKYYNIINKGRLNNLERLYDCACVSVEAAAKYIEQLLFVELTSKQNNAIFTNDFLSELI